MKIFFTYNNEFYSFGVFREWDEHFYYCFELAWIVLLGKMSLLEIEKSFASLKGVS